MTKRIEWTCPECCKRFAIPAKAKMPERCPGCQQADSKKKPKASAKTTPVNPPSAPSVPPLQVPAIETPIPTFDESPPALVQDVVPAISTPSAEQTRQAQRQIRRTYPNLKALSLASKILGVMIIIVTLTTNVMQTLNLNKLNDAGLFKTSGDFVMMLLQVNVAILLIGCSWALAAFVVSELILLFINIEENTR